jgi:hypothetical protein
MNPLTADSDDIPSIGPMIAWTQDKIALLEERLELARLKGELQTHIDGRIVMVDFGETFVKSLRLELSARKRAQTIKVPGLE